MGNEGNVKALKNYSTRSVEIAQHMINDMTLCNSTVNVVDKLQKVLDARSDWIAWRYKGKELIVLAPDHTEFRNLFTQEERYNLNGIGRINLLDFKKKLVPLGS